MNKLLTQDYNFIKEFDELAAEVYLDKKYYHLDINEIARYREITSDKTLEYFTMAKRVLREKDSAWLTGLSTRAKAAILKNRYMKYEQLYSDVMNEKIDLECFRGVGHKVALEIRRWCLRHS